MTLIAKILNKIGATDTDRPPVSTCKTIADKDKLAGWIVGNYLRNGSATLRSVLERKADVRSCSLICRHMAEAIFSSYGPDIFENIKAEVEAMGYHLEAQRSGRLADTRSLASTVTPVKYKGFGSTLCYPSYRGHLFQINMLSFVEKKPIVGILETTSSNPSEIIKGGKEVATRGPWRLIQLNPELSDDMTALIVKPEKEDIKVEFAYFSSVNDIDFKMIYRINTQR